MYTIRDGYDRRKNPQWFKVRPLTFEETLILKRRDELLFHANDGTARRCRVTGQVKMWKTRPNDLRVPVKYGMFESAYCEWRSGVHHGVQLLVECCSTTHTCSNAQTVDTTGGLVTECIPCGFYHIDPTRGGTE